VTPEDDAVVFVVDDDAGVRDAIGSLLRSVGLRMQAFTSTSEFLGSLPRHTAGCLVLDVRLPGTSGLELQRQLRASGEHIPVIFITGHGDIPMSVEAMKAGAVEFLTKPVRGQELLTAVQKAIRQDRDARQSRKALDDLRARLADLSPREREVMALVITGLLNKEIAAALGTSERTVKIQRAQVMRKMKADSLPDLVLMGQRLGIVPKDY
jgi:FixJ family two-component response regulator